MYNALPRTNTSFLLGLALSGALWRRGEKGEGLLPLFRPSPQYPREPPSPRRACSKVSLFLKITSDESDKGWQLAKRKWIPRITVKSFRNLLADIGVKRGGKVIPGRSFSVQVKNWKKPLTGLIFISEAHLIAWLEDYHGIISIFLFHFDKEFTQEDETDLKEESVLIPILVQRQLLEENEESR